MLITFSSSRFTRLRCARRKSSCVMLLSFIAMRSARAIFFRKLKVRSTHVCDSGNEKWCSAAVRGSGNSLTSVRL